MLHTVIMAGGAGTRFWPASRAAMPKQLLDLAGGRTMIQSTVARFAGLVESDQILIVTNERLCGAVADQLPELRPSSILGEPCKRDTAPCIGLAAALVSRDDDDAIMAVSPADHVIEPEAAFQDAIRQAVDLVKQDGERIVTLGINPAYPAETFGYIERGDPLVTGSSTSASPTYQVRKFREKPAREVAQQYFDSGAFYWNSGIFVWRADTILKALAERQPEMHSRIMTIANTMGDSDFTDVFRREFEAIQGTSIDYAVMEHHRNVVVIEAPFHWDDLGSWTALARLRGVNERGHTSLGRHLDVGSQGLIVRTSDDHLVATMGLEDCIVVHTPDATLVANRRDEESMRKIVQLIQDNGWEEYL
jgi:mannose-1-phosphate guanylyltransferase